MMPTMMKPRISNLDTSAVMRTYLKIVILSFVCSFLLPVGSHAQSRVAQSCTFCHGSLGKGFMSAPRIAGQRQQYLVTQLWGFKNHKRNNPNSRQFMWPAADPLNSNTIREVAIYYSKLQARPANDGNREQVATGRKIFQDGIPHANVVACAACHGPNAEGSNEIPRIGGLSYRYLKQRLTEWTEGYHPSTVAPMPKISGALSQHQIEALASYLSFVH
jgi:cytochrome c553